MAISNPRPKKLIVLKVEYKNNDGLTNYLFPLNPTEFNVTQASRVNAVFTYGEKVFQNLGRGLKTLTISGHTGYKLNYDKYGLFSATADSVESSGSLVSGSKLQSTLASQDPSFSDGEKLFLDLYSLIQLIKGENIFISGGRTEDEIFPRYSVENIDKIKNVSLVIPDQGIVYDVLLQNDSFMRNREQPHLYKYSLSFVVTNEAVSFRRSLPTEGFFVNALRRLGIMKDGASTVSDAFDGVKETILGIPGVSTAVTAYNDLISNMNDASEFLNSGLTEFNKRANDLRRLEKINDVLTGTYNAIANMRLALQIIESYSTTDAFYETKINSRRVSRQASLLYDQLKSQKDQLTFLVAVQRLASTDTPVTISANKATIAMVRKDIKDLDKTGFVIPIDKVEEIETSSGRKISITFSQSPSSLGISDIKVFATNDYSRSNNLVSLLSDEQMILAVSYFSGGRIYDFQIEYDYKTFEQINKLKYKSIRRIKIRDGETFESILKANAPNEVSSISTYASEVAYLNNIEFPYVVTKSDSKYYFYQGSHAFVNFADNAEFLKYISNIVITGTEGQLLPLYSYENVKDSFAIDETDLITALLPSNVKFFVLLFKETYSNRLYALYGLFTDYASSEAYLFQAEQYFFVAIEKGLSYEVKENVIFEILSPYTINDDLIAFYGQQDFLDSLSETDLFTRDSLVIKNIYDSYVGSFSHDSFVFTADDKQFLAGDDDNKQYPLLTNFVEYPIADSYDITAFKKYRILLDQDYILLPSLSDKFLSFQNAVNGQDVYKVDLDLNFIAHEIIHARPDLGPTDGTVDFLLINGIPNVKQALYHRLITPKGGLRLHSEYGLPQLLGKKNTLENLTLLKYNLFDQITSDNRVKSISNISATSDNDEMSSEVSVILVNNDEVTVR